MVRYGKGIQNLMHAIEQIAASDSPVLIVGERGTGKGWLARRIHETSKKSSGVFVCVDCAANDVAFVDREIPSYGKVIRFSDESPQTLLERAKGGTVFFDELIDLPLTAQREVATIFREQSIRRFQSGMLGLSAVRLIASSSRERELHAGGRNQWEEAYACISPIIINVPPLRERRRDIPDLIEGFLHDLNDRQGTTIAGITPEALHICLGYDWPGNVRQLRNAIQCAVAACHDHFLKPEHLPSYVHGRKLRYHQTFVILESMIISDAERLLVQNALRRSRTKKEAAAVLGISLKTLYNKLSKYNLGRETLLGTAKENPSDLLSTQDEESGIERQ